CFSSRRRHTSFSRDWSSDVCSSDLQARQNRPDMKVVVIDPRKTATCDIADLHLPLRPGADAFLFNGLLTYLKQHDSGDWHYLERSEERRVGKESRSGGSRRQGR